VSKAKPRKLSELEGVSLGIIFKRQLCTAYELRSELKKAPSSHWRASAGSVYPLLARLEQDGLISSTSDENDGRGRKLIQISAAGRRALRNWVLTGVEMEHVSSVTDPLRSRTFFLDVLSDVKQTEFIDRLLKEMQEYLSATTTHLNEISAERDLYDYLGALGAVKITEARLEWLREVRAQLMKATPD
jgi:DNA-binding PadR family transcriptional regulator